MSKIIPAVCLSIALSACSGEAVTDQPDAPASGQVSGEEVADALDDAASQSVPAARAVLEDAADVAEDQESLDPVGEPGSFAQDAMQAAGDAASREDRDQRAEE